MAETADICWRPQPGPQAALIGCPVFEIFYGGARGGGKTDGMLGKNLLKAQRFGEHQKGIFLRKEMPQLEAAIDRSKAIYYPTGATWGDQKKTWTFRNGATFKFRQIERDADAEKYQGHDYTDVYFEELPNYADPGPVNKMKATLRSATGVPCQFHATGNPGGPGHSWVKVRYIDPCPSGFEVLEEETRLPDGSTVTTQRVFIPAKLHDNQILVANDPGYVGRLAQSGSETLVKAWLDGDWNIVEGAYFDCWSSAMVLAPGPLPDHWTHFRAFDWGSAKPFSVGWWAIASEDFIHQGQRIPRGAIIRYREWYGSKGPNVGLKLTAEQVSQGILDRDNEEIRYSVADPSIFSEDGGPSIAARMKPIFWRRADNARVARKGHIGGWDQMRARMKGEDDRPMIYCFSTCTDSIRTIPVLQHDERISEDLDTNAEDHAADEWRYACMSRPYVPPKAEAKPKKVRDRYWTEKDEDSWKTS